MACKFEYLGKVYTRPQIIRMVKTGQISTPDTVLAARKWLESTLGMDESQIEVVHGLIQNKSMGRLLRDGRILLSSVADLDTGYEEGFHRVFRTKVKDDVRQSLRAEWMQRPMATFRLAELRNSYPDISEEDLIEEGIAKDFVQYMNSEGAMYLPPIEKSVFDSILDFLRKLLGIGQRKLSIQELYSSIKAGEYKSKPSEVYKLNSTADSVLESPVPLEFKQEIIQNIVTRVFQEAAQRKDISLLIKEGIDGGAFIRAVRELTTKELEEDVALKVADDILNDDRQLRKDSVLFNAVQSYLRLMKIEMSGVLDDQAKEEDIDEVSTNVEDESNTVKDRAFNKVSFAFDPRSKIKKSIIILLNSIFDSESLSPKLGLLRPIPYNHSSGVLFEILSGVPSDYDIVIEELRANVEDHPWLSQVINALGGELKNAASTPKELIRLGNDFVTSFTKNKYTYNKGLIRKGRINMVNLASDDQSSKYVKLWRGRVDQFNRDQNDLIASLKSATTPMQIANVLGFEEITERMIELPISDEGVDTVASKLTSMRDIIIEGLGAGVPISKIYQRLPKEQAKFEIRGSVLQLAKVASMYGKPLDLMLLNTNKDRIYSISLHNYQTQVIGTLNWIARRGTTVEERIEMVKRHLPHLAGPMLINNGEVRSAWLRNIVNGISLNFEVFDGAQSRQKVRTGSKIKGSDILAFHINAMEEGRMFSFKHGDRSTIFSYKFNNGLPNNAKGYADSVKYHTNQMLNYLEVELTKLSLVGKSTAYGKHITNWSKRGKNQTMFPFLAKNDIQKILKQKNWTKGDLERMFGDDIRQHLIEKGMETWQAMKRNMIFQDTPGKKDIPIGIDTEIWGKYFNASNENAEQAQREMALNAYANHTYSYFEQAMLFTGDPANYKNSSDFFKRIQMQSSTGTPLAVGRLNDEHLSGLNVRDTFNMYDEPGTFTYGELKVMGLQSEIVLYNRAYDSAFAMDTESPIAKVFRYGLINDYVSQGYTQAEAEKRAQAVSQSWLDAYKGYEENDGQSYVNIFYWREYEHRLGNWSDEKENTFQLELAVLRHRNIADTRVWIDPNDRFSISANEVQGYVEIQPFDSNSVREVTGLDYQRWFNIVFDYANIKKPQYTGPFIKDLANRSDAFNIVAGRKTSYAVLIPSVIRGTNLDKMNSLMLRKGIDSIHMESAAKYGKEDKGSFAPTTAYDLYNEQGEFNPEIEQYADNMVSYLDIGYQKDQLEVGNKPKGKIKNATQSAKLMFSNLFSSGVPKDFKGEGFSALSEAKKKESSPIYSAYAKYRDAISAQLEQQMDNLREEIGNDRVKGLAAILSRNAAAEQEPTYIMDSINLFVEQQGLELIPNWNRVENLLYAIVTNNVLNMNRPGDGKAQFAVSMWESGNRTMNEGRVQNSDALKFYEPVFNEAGDLVKVEPAECIIPLPPKMIDQLLYMSKKSNLIDAIEWYNSLPDADKVIMKGLRIPNQQLSFNEVLRVKKFTSPMLQSFIVLPSEIVVKAGGDFDIDKMQLYFPSRTAISQLVSDEISPLSDDILAAEIELMLSGYNAHHLLAPATDNWLKNDTFSDIMSKREGKTPGEILRNRENYVLRVSDETLFDVGVNAENGVALVESKSNVGIVATSITAHSLGQVDNQMLSDEVVVTIDDKEIKISTKLMFPSRTGFSMGALFDVNGNFILDGYSGVLTSQVDALKDNYAAAINMTEETIPILMYLMRQGVDPKMAIKLFNVPLVRRYLDVYVKNNSLLASSDYRLRTKASKIGEKLAQTVGINSELFTKITNEYRTGVGREITEEELDAAISSGEPSADQIRMLISFLQLRDINRAFRKYMTDVAADTKPRKNRDAVMAYEDNYSQMIDSKVLPAGSTPHRSGFLKPFFEAQRMYKEMFFDLYMIPGEFIDNISGRISKGKSADDIGRVRGKIANDFIVFVLQNFHDKFSEYTFENLFTGPNSIAREVLAFRGDANAEFVMDNILPMVNEVFDPYTQKKIDVIKLAERGASVHHANDLYEAFSLLPDSLQERLMFASLHQAGLGRSPFSLDMMLNVPKVAELMADIRKTITDVLNRPNTPDEFAKLFFFNNPGFLPYSDRDSEESFGLTSRVSDVTSDYVIIDQTGANFYPFGNQYYLRYDMSMQPMNRPTDEQMNLGITTGVGVGVNFKPGPVRLTNTSVVPEYTPDNIQSLPANGIFVFGSNTEGRHGKGAALTAKTNFGAVYGQAKGLQGRSYAIVTKNLTKGEKSIPLSEIGLQIRDFYEFAASNSNLKFYVTKLGSSLAGYTPNEIRGLFIGAGVKPENVILPREYSWSEEEGYSVRVGTPNASPDIPSYVDGEAATALNEAMKNGLIDESKC